MSLKDKIKSQPSLKKAAAWLLNGKNDPRPRWVIRSLVNPFFHSKSNGAKIRSFARLDVFPYNKFTIGKNSIIEDFTVINNGVGDLYIGDNTMIGIGSVLIGPAKVGNNVMLAQHVVASGLNHQYTDVNIPTNLQPVVCKEIIIEDEVWIGANAVITSGVVIGKHAVIGAGSVVTKSIPPYSVAVGNPAKVVKKYNFETNLWENIR